jgi:hypothetical protein
VRAGGCSRLVAQAELAQAKIKTLERSNRRLVALVITVFLSAVSRPSRPPRFAVGEAIWLIRDVALIRPRASAGLGVE